MYNGTQQRNFDIIVEVKNGLSFNLAFDHKVKDFESCIKDIQKNGLKSQKLTTYDFSNLTLLSNSILNRNQNIKSLMDASYEVLKELVQKVENNQIIQNPIVPVLLCNNNDICKTISIALANNNQDFSFFIKMILTCIYLNLSIKKKKIY